MTTATANQKPKGAQAPSAPTAAVTFTPAPCASFLLGKTPEQAGVYLLTYLKRRLGNQSFRWEANWNTPADQYVFDNCFKEK